MPPVPEILKLAKIEVLGCNLVQFNTPSGKILPQKGRLFAILVSVA
jgi:hypothetical protein